MYQKVPVFWEQEERNGSGVVIKREAAGEWCARIQVKSVFCLLNILKGLAEGLGKRASRLEGGQGFAREKDFVQDSLQEETSCVVYGHRRQSLS